MHRLYWLDITGREVFHLDSDGTVHRHSVPWMVGCLGLTARDGVLVAGTEEGFALLDLPTGSFRTVVCPEGHGPGVRFNDGKVGPDGCFWAGSMPLSAKGPAGAFYRLGADLSCQRLFGDVRCSNGLDWDLGRGVFYYIDTPRGAVEAFAYEAESGVIAGRRPVVDLGPSRLLPDGLCLDGEGQVWVALWNGGGVARFDPATGERTAYVEVPAANVTSCAFGGPDLRTLFITTASGGREHPGLPHSGCLFTCRPGVTGLQPHRFKGPAQA